MPTGHKRSGNGEKLMNMRREVLIPLLKWNLMSMKVTVIGNTLLALPHNGEW